MRAGLTTIYGQVPSKSNSYRVVIVGGHGALAKTRALAKYESDFKLQNPLRGSGITGRFRLDVDVYYQSDRPDLDNALKTILDCLQADGSIVNDRQCIEIVARKFVDKQYPRIEYKITEL